MNRIRIGAMLAFGPVLLLGPAAHAITPAQSSKAYTDECGSCHMAYPTRLLSRTEWARVLGQLDHHFGVDASLDAATLQAVARQLGVAGQVTTAPGQSAPAPRISTQPWFVREHREVAGTGFRSPAVKSASNCSACHAGAARGDFEDDGGDEKEGHGHD